MARVIRLEDPEGWGPMVDIETGIDVELQVGSSIPSKLNPAVNAIEARVGELTQYWCWGNLQLRVENGKVAFWGDIYTYDDGEISLMRQCLADVEKMTQKLAESEKGALAFRMNIHQHFKYSPVDSDEETEARIWPPVPE